jgi:3-phytase
MPQHLTSACPNAAAMMILILALAAPLGCAGSHAERVPLIEAQAETLVVSSEGDAADDPAVWVHPTAAERSLIIGTDKKEGLNVYDLRGALVQRLPDGRMNNVDVVQGLKVRVAADKGVGTIDLVLASERNRDELAAYAVHPASGRLTPLAGAPFATGVTGVYGLCAYIDPRDGDARVVINNKQGAVHVYALRPPAGGLAGGPWRSERVHTLQVGTQLEGCVADVEHGWLYIGEECVGVWRYPLPGRQMDEEAPARTLLDAVPSLRERAAGGLPASRLARDVEGVDIYRLPGGQGWVLVSCQAEDRVACYDRVTGAYAGSFRVQWREPGGAIDPVTHTDGLTVSSAPLGPLFPRGVLVMQDDNEGTRQDFKIIDWRQVGALLPEPALAPRK